MSDTQDTLIEQVARAWASIDGKAELFDSEKEADGYGTGVYMGYVAEADELLKRSGLATALADSDAEIARLTSERAALAEAAANFWTAVDRAEAAEAEAAALRERLERSSKQIEYALTKASLSAPEKISDALSLARALQNKEQANG